MILMKRLILYLTAAFILAGCGLARPLTPEQRAVSAEEYCRDSVKSLYPESQAKADSVEAEFKELGLSATTAALTRKALLDQAIIDKRIAYRNCLYIYGN